MRQVPETMTNDQPSASARRVSRAHALGVLAAGAAAIPHIVGAQPAPLKLRVGSVPADTFAGGYYALELGLFDKAGLSVEITPFTNGAAMAAAAAGGSIDIGVGDATELANGIARGLPFVLIAGGGVYATAAPTTTLCVAKTSTIAKPSELEGQNVAVVSLVSLMSSGVKSWLTQNGADISKVHFVEMPFPQMPGALARGALAAATLSEPIMSDATATDAKVFGKPYDAIAKTFNISDWFTTRDWLAKNPDAAKRFVAAIYDAARWANTHHDESAAILAKYTKVDVERIKRMNRSAYATDLQRGMVQPVLDTAFKFKTLTTATTADSMIAKGF
jgi:NitT/TauT family transport system substrate-binding protein